MGAPESWLLLTSLKPHRAALLEYTSRWGIERLFQLRKSHGWHLEASHLHDPARLVRLLSGLVIATLWRLAAGVADADHHLADLRRRATRQLWLPCVDAAAPPAPSRPYVAKRSLFTCGTNCWERINGRRESPPYSGPSPIGMFPPGPPRPPAPLPAFPRDGQFFVHPYAPRRSPAASGARVCVRHCPVVLRPPLYRAAERLPTTAIWVVLAREEDPPTDQEPLRWLLLTTCPVLSRSDAVERLD